MKSIRFVIPVLILPFFATGQQNYKPDFSPIRYNYKNCVLTIKAGARVKEANTECIPITAVITNNSNDTLKYESFTNCWLDYYTVDDKKLSLYPTEEIDCLSNIPKVITVLPHKSHTDWFSVYKRKGTNEFPREICILFSLVLSRTDIPERLLDDLYFIKDKGNSNSIAAARKKDRKKWTHILTSNSVTI